MHAQVTACKFVSPLTIFRNQASMYIKRTRSIISELISKSIRKSWGPIYTMDHEGSSV